MERQAKVEAKLWQFLQADPLLSPTPAAAPDAAPTPDADPTRPPSLFFYDVTSLQRLQKGKLSVWITLEVKERVVRLQQDEKLLEEHAKLDGCYAIVSDLLPAMASSEELHDRYKDLAKVESGFRTLKHGHLEIRPWYVTSEANTRAHALTAMLALKVRRRLQQAWEPINVTVEEGLRELGSFPIMEIYEKTSGQSVSRQMPEPNELQARLIGALGLSLPKQAPAAGPIVVTRVELQKRRKSAWNLYSIRDSGILTHRTALEVPF